MGNLRSNMTDEEWDALAIRSEIKLEGLKGIAEDFKSLEPNHYDNTKGSLYQFAEDKGLNPYEFDIIKRIVRCRKKGNFKEDLEKTKFLIDLYLKEHGV
jgi:hypothetical protein